MSTSDKGDSSYTPAGPRTTREALFNRLAERHAQTKAAQLSRRNEHSNQSGSNNASANMHSTKQTDFLPNFIQTKTEILDNLDRAIEQRKQDALSMADLTTLLDDTQVQIEDLQTRFNEMCIYLTAFDCEQVGLELKNLQTQFQSRREELLPSKKFAFSRSRPKKPSGTSAPTVNPKGESERPKPTDQSLTKFDDRFSLVDVEDNSQLILPKPGSENVIGPDNSVYLAQLKRCTVHVRGVCGNLIARRLHQCRVYIYPVAGSVWLEDCHQCDFVVACRQLRVHQTTDCRLGLHMASRPIIEHSTGLRVGPYPLHYSALETDLTRAGLSPEVNLWREVEDFSHPNKRLTTGSPNWSILPEIEWDSLKPDEP